VLSPSAPIGRPEDLLAVAALRRHIMVRYGLARLDRAVRGRAGPAESRDRVRRWLLPVRSPLIFVQGCSRGVAKGAAPEGRKLEIIIVIVVVEV
jgi:hypothetical protein